MRFYCKASTPEEVMRQLRECRSKHPKEDTHLEISDLSLVAVKTLAENLPEWIKSISFGRKLLPNIQKLFLENLPPNKTRLVQPLESIGTKRKITDEEPAAKELRKDEDESSNVNPEFLTSGLISNFIASTNDMDLVKLFIFASKRHRREVYFRLLKIVGQKHWDSQGHLLAMLIKNGSLLLEISGIETALINYRNRGDIPIEGQILAIGCLVIMAILKNNNEDFQVKLRELFIFAVPFSDYFNVLCCYIYRYKGEFKKPQELAQKVIESGSVPFYKFHEDFTQQKSVSVLLDQIRQEEARTLSHSSLAQLLKPNMAPFRAQRGFNIDLTSRYLNIFLERIKRLQKEKKLADEFHLAEYFSNPTKVSPVVYLPSVCKQDPDYVAICFFLNFSWFHFPYPMFRALSQEMKEKIIFVLFAGLEEMMNNRFCVLDEAEVIWVVPPHFGPGQIMAQFSFYLSLISILQAKEKFIDFVKIQLRNIIAMGRMTPEQFSNTIRLIMFQMKVSYMTASFIASDMYQKQKINWLSIISKSDITHHLVEELWWIYQNEREEDEKLRLLKPIAGNYLKCRNPLSIPVEEITRALFLAILQKYQTYQNKILAGCPDEIRALVEDDMVIISNLNDLCTNSCVDTDEEVKQYIFQLLTSMYDMSEGELLLIVLRCCFKNEKEFNAFLKSAIIADAKEDISKLFLSKEELFTHRNKWTATALTFLAPYMEIEVIEKYFDQLYELVIYMLDNKAQLGQHREYNKFLYSFVLAIINLLFFLSPKKRDSLPLNFKGWLVKGSYGLSISTLNRINEDEELIRLYSFYLNHMRYKSVHNCGFLDLAKLAIERKILAKLYENESYFDPDYVTAGWKENSHHLLLEKIAPMMSSCINLASTKGPEEKSKVLQKFEQSMSGAISEEMQKLFNDISAPLVELPVNLRLFKVACLGHNAACLLYVLRQYENLKDNEKAEFKTQIEQQLQQFKIQGYKLYEKMEEILTRFRQENISQPLTSPGMQIG